MLRTPIDIWTPLARVRAASPLVHNITNYVVMNSTANALLAIGASPAMVHALEEVEEFVALSRALVINIGTLSPPWVEAMRRAVRSAKRAGIPWVLDPVGAGATSYRTATAAALIGLGPTVIRGNASEIAAVGGGSDAGGKGVDSTRTSASSLGVAKALARTTSAIVAMTGAVDYVTDGGRVVAIRNGDPLMARVTGLGCTASALVGAFLVGPDPFEATVAALTVLGVAGEVAAIRSAGPGSLQLELLDALHALDRATLTGRARVEWVEGAPP
ncbi:MAG: hydroxyethylthiazole kinase [Gemmatimonadota bacterium]